METAEYINFAEVVKEIASNKKLVPDLLKAENGNNFRAVSESAILDVVSPVLDQQNIYYTVEIKDQHLDIREAFGSKGKKLQFIATITIKLKFWRHWQDDDRPSALVETEGVGMGIDDNDKAMGKAYTYAVKYALLKLFRLRYGDDPDFEASKPLHTEMPKEEKITSKKEDKKAKSAEKSQKSEKNSKEIAMTEAQRDYILGLLKTKGVVENTIIGKFGYEPSRDEFIPMKVARAIIEWLNEQEDLPF